MKFEHELFPEIPVSNSIPLSITVISIFLSQLDRLHFRNESGIKVLYLSQIQRKLHDTKMSEKKSYFYPCLSTRNNNLGSTSVFITGVPQLITPKCSGGFILMLIWWPALFLIFCLIVVVGGTVGALILLQTHSVPKRDEGTRIIYFLALILGVVLYWSMTWI